MVHAGVFGRRLFIFSRGLEVFRATSPSSVRRLSRRRHPFRCRRRRREGRFLVVAGTPLLLFLVVRWKPPRSHRNHGRSAPEGLRSRPHDRGRSHGGRGTSRGACWCRRRDRAAHDSIDCYECTPNLSSPILTVIIIFWWYFL